MTSAQVERLPTDQLASMQSDALLAAIVRSSSDAIIAKDLTGIVMSWNPAASRIFGYSAEEMVGQSIRKLIPEDRQAEEDMILARISAGEQVKFFETVRRTASGRDIPVSVTISPVRAADGRIIGASKILRDLSERRAIDERLRDTEARFETLADHMAQLAWMADPDGYIFWYNRRWYSYTGTSFDQMKGSGWTAVQHPDHLPRVMASFTQALKAGTEWEETFPLRGADGEYRWFLSRAVPIRDADGRVTRWLGTNTDVTEQRRQQEQIKLLMGEVNHRSKNMLAMIQSLARRTAPTEHPEFTERFEQRIRALAANQDLLMSRNWSGAFIADLIRTQLCYVDDLVGSRIELDGPPLLIKPAPSETIGMAIHELCTNAAKYGALSNATGRVRIEWSVDSSCTPPRFSLCWRETGGPALQASPTRQGFGTTVIERIPRMSLQAEVQRDFSPAGFQWHLRCQAERVVDGDLLVGDNAPSADTEDGDEQRILIVEDEMLVALELITTLEEAGLTVIGPAATLEAAMEQLDRHRFSLAILDVNLGRGESSAPLAERLQSLGIPFFVTTGYASDQRPAVFQGVPSFLKPVASHAILKAVKQALS